MLIKIIVCIAILLIMVSLFRGLFFLVKEGGNKSDNTVKALTWRVGLTMALFLFVMLAGALGWIEPHSLQAPLETATPAAG